MIRKNFAQSALCILTIILINAFTNQTSAQKPVNDSVRSNTNKNVIGISSPQVSTTVVINEIYTGGGNTGASYNQDYVELYNVSGNNIDLTNFTLQYAAATGTGNYTVCTITSANTPGGTIITAGGYFLIATGPTGSVGSALTGIDTTCPNTTTFNFSATAGKIALSSTATTLSAASCPPTNGTVIDFIGYGSTANCSETAPAPIPSTATASTNFYTIQRIPNGTDTDNNSADFRIATGTPKAANSVSGNNAPTISDIQDKTTNVNTAIGPFNFTIGDTETINTSLTVTATSSNQTLVPNANITLGGTNATRNITLTPAANQTGTTTITVTVSDGITTTSDTFVLTVNAAAGSPVITSANSATFTIGTAGTFSVTTTGSPTPAITESGVLPSGLSFLDNGNGTATISGTPAAGTQGNYPLTITATNSGGTISQSFTLTVNLGSTAAAVNVGGRVLDDKGIGVSRAIVMMTDGSGKAYSASTDSAGNYLFEGIEVGQTLIFTVRAKRYIFAQQSQVVSLSEEIMTVDFRANEVNHF